MRVLLIDNFDSFVYNLAQCFGAEGAEPIVVRSDAPLEDLVALRPDRVVISPGPGRPEDAGISGAAVQAFATEVPVLGVCLGHQVIATTFGATVDRARVGPVHGKPSAIDHQGEGVFTGLESPFDAIRYHSLAVVPETVPDGVEVTGRSDDGTIMGIRHRHLPVEGVQFHPESVLTEDGPKILRNFLAR